MINRRRVPIIPAAVEFFHLDEEGFAESVTVVTPCPGVQG
jgi:hypothetical protein